MAENITQKIQSGPFSGLRQNGYSVILADPPWPYNRRDNDGTRFGRGMHAHYPPMKVDAICALPVQQLSAPRSILFLWTTGPFLEASFQVMNAWGFSYSTIGFDWIKIRKCDSYEPGIQSDCPMPNQTPSGKLQQVKTHKGPGNFTMSNNELCLIGARGTPRLERANRNVGCSIIAPLQEHSRKPLDAHLRIEHMYGFVPKIELFSRRTRQGWSCWGNQLKGE